MVADGTTFPWSGFGAGARLRSPARIQGKRITTRPLDNIVKKGLLPPGRQAREDRECSEFLSWRPAGSGFLDFIFGCFNADAFARLPITGSGRGVA
jgi:hypothetical protein